jgi:type I restriction enzyme M protein
MKSDIARPDPITATYNEIMSKDKTSLDIFWLKDNSLTDLENLPDPDVLVKDIIENLESSLESLREISNNLGKEQ